MAQAPKRAAARPTATPAPRGVPDTEPGMIAPSYEGARSGLRDLSIRPKRDASFATPEPPIKLARGGRAAPKRRKR